MPSKYWSDWSWRDFAAADMRNYVAVLPVAATEQHGPHLPVGVDNYINQGYLARAVALTPDDMPVLYLPVQAIGKSNEHIEFPGTTSSRGSCDKNMRCSPSTPPGIAWACPRACSAPRSARTASMAARSRPR